jgi:hypothetical protein
MLRMLPLPVLDSFESGFDHCIYTSQYLVGPVNFDAKPGAKEGSTVAVLMNFFVLPLILRTANALEMFNGCQTTTLMAGRNGERFPAQVLIVQCSP